MTIISGPSIFSKGRFDTLTVPAGAAFFVFEGCLQRMFFRRLSPPTTQKREKKGLDSLFYAMNAGVRGRACRSGHRGNRRDPPRREDGGRRPLERRKMAGLLQPCPAGGRLGRTFRWAWSTRESTIGTRTSFWRTGSNDLGRAIQPRLHELSCAFRIVARLAASFLARRTWIGRAGLFRRDNRARPVSFLCKFQIERRHERVASGEGQGEYTSQGCKLSFLERENFPSVEAIEGNQSFQLWSGAAQLNIVANFRTPDQDGLVTFEGPRFKRKLELKPFKAYISRGRLSEPKLSP